MRVMTGLGVALLGASVTTGAAPLGISARTVIPWTAQQIISVDYRRLQNSETAMAMKEALLSQGLKQLEQELRNLRVDPERDVDQLTFASYRRKNEVRVVGVAEGRFPTERVLMAVKARNAQSLKYGTALLHRISGRLEMTFLDDSTLLFAEHSALRDALDARNGYTLGLGSDLPIVGMMPAVATAPIWSVLDRQGTLTMIAAVLGDRFRFAEHEIITKRLLGSRYALHFSRGISFDLDVLFVDSITAATLTTLMKAAVLYETMRTASAEKAALGAVTVRSDGSSVHVHFAVDDPVKVEALMRSDLFRAVSR